MTTKRMILGLLILMALFFSTGIVIATEPTKAPIYVSLLQLIANPSRYDGLTVSVRGYFRDRYEETALFLSKDDSDYRITMNSIWCNFNEDKLCETAHHMLKPPRYSDAKFVLVEGIFRYNHHGPSIDYPAEIIMRKIIEIPSPRK